MVQQKNKWPRIREVDIAKGLAGLLMIVAHLEAGRFFPAGTFAAPLFFACSGMNTVLLIQKTVKIRAYDFFHLLFPVILFFGGTIQVAIAHNDHWRVIPEFLQLIALSGLLVFLLAKVFRSPYASGYFFPVPFIIQQLLPHVFQEAVQYSPLGFVFGSHFALFPWLGFVLFGIFVLGLRHDLYRWLQGGLALAFVLTSVFARIPLNKFWMSLSYILIALLLITMVFSLSRLIVRRGAQVFFKGLSAFFSLPGRNSLMFIFLHYGILHYLTASFYFFPLWLKFTAVSLFFFYVCNVGLMVYEKVKNDESLFFPVLAVGLALAGLRLLHPARPRVSMYLINLLIGVCFAFLYVQLRRRFAARYFPAEPLPLSKKP